MANNIDLKAIAARYQEQMSRYKNRIVVCGGTGCMANGSQAVYDELRSQISARGLRVTVALEKEEADYCLCKSGCQGFCQMGPLLTIWPQGVFYERVQREDVAEIIERTLLGGELVERLLHHTSEGETVTTEQEVPFYAGQQRITLKRCGLIDAQDIDEYIGHGGYAQAERACCKMKAEDICGELLASGLRGRGGAGFPTGRKWELTRVQPGPVKYVICNGDEGDPGAFMDRSLMEGNPHAVLEGMIIAAKAVGATEGYIYVRMEYPLAVERLRFAIDSARERGLLGENIFGSAMSFDVEVMEGAGAFVCGEETALIASIEGKRGMPSMKPPFPAERGLFGKPTVINNVETLATVPLILEMGAANYALLGTATAKGTKTFALTGNVAHTGLIEVPFGATLRQIIGDIGGGVINDDGSNVGTNFKAVQIGGPSGGCLTTEYLDMPLDYENLQKIGAMVGSGGLVVMNHQICMVQIARFFMQFTQNESCGKCVICREGSRQMLVLLDDILEGRATAETIELLEELAENVKLGSLCALGKTAPNPVISTLKHFRAEYNAHVFNKFCPTGNCTALKKFKIDAQKCKCCGLCARKCTVGAINGAKGVPYEIDGAKCIKCAACVDVCKFDAISG